MIEDDRTLPPAPPWAAPAEPPPWAAVQPSPWAAVQPSPWAAGSQPPPWAAAQPPPWAAGPPVPAGGTRGRRMPPALLMVVALAVGVLGGGGTGVVLGAASRTLLTRPAADPVRPAPSFPQEFPEGSKRVLAGVSRSDLRARGTKNGFTCRESEVRSSGYSILYCDGKPWTTRYQAEYLPSGEVITLTVRCHAPLADPKACDRLFTDVTAIAFTGQPALRDEAVRWVTGHVRQNAATSLGSVDVVSTLQDESMTFSGRG